LYYFDELFALMSVQVQNKPVLTGHPWNQLFVQTECKFIKGWNRFQVYSALAINKGLA
jgi:hypothetical protein